MRKAGKQQQRRTHTHTHTHARKALLSLFLPPFSAHTPLPHFHQLEAPLLPTPGRITRLPLRHGESIASMSASGYHSAVLTSEGRCFTLGKRISLADTASVREELMMDAAGVDDEGDPNGDDDGYYEGDDDPTRDLYDDYADGI